MVIDTITIILNQFLVFMTEEKELISLEFRLKTGMEMMRGREVRDTPLI